MIRELRMREMSRERAGGERGKGGKKVDCGGKRVGERSVKETNERKQGLEMRKRRGGDWEGTDKGG